MWKIMGGERETEIESETNWGSARESERQWERILDRGDTLFDDLCNYELCTRPQVWLTIPLSTTYPHPKYRRAHIGPPIIFLTCALLSSTLGLDRRKWKGLSNRGLISPSLLSIWKWASTRFISRLLMLAPLSCSSDRRKREKTSHRPPRNKARWSWPVWAISILPLAYIILPYQKFYLLIWNYPDISHANLIVFQSELVRFLWPFIQAGSISHCTHLSWIQGTGEAKAQGTFGGVK